MNLWIRTQNRENTVKIINGYGLKYNDKKTIIANYQPDFTDKYDGYYDILGTYETKERALEVLDEIQSKINDIHKDYLMSCMKEKGTYEIIAWEDFVYEMPKK